MRTFSANLGFLWTELSLPQAIFAAHEAGFDAVECHWPYATPASEVREALTVTGLSMLGLNTNRGDTDAGENGLAALLGRETDARVSIDEALKYAREIDTPNIHVMAGFNTGEKAHQTFVDNLTHACDEAARFDKTILIEPLNHYDAPGYFLNTTSQAIAIIEEVARPNLKLMFDCYHVQLMEGDVSNRLRKLKDHIGHIQFASVPDRGPPDGGELSYAHIFDVITDMDYDRPLGAEYKPRGDTDPTLGWMKTLR